MTSPRNPSRDSSRNLISNPVRSTSEKGIQKIALLDTTVTSVNLGDQVIMDAARGILKEIYPDAFYVNFPTHEFFLWESYRVLKGCDKIFVGGSNLLKSKMIWNNQWKISPLDILLRRNCILLGCGWWHYQSAPDFYSRMALRAVLSKDHFHSVRDGYTRQQLQKAGVPKVLNTACITMWGLTPEHCMHIPTQKAPRAVLSLTAYNADPQADKALVDMLLREYAQVFLWVQQPDDYAYGMQLSGGRLTALPPNLQAYTDFLRDNHVDCIGSRLHGGIRALQMGKRTLVLAIDNRAVEVSRDTMLPVISRKEISLIGSWINGIMATRIQLPQADIDAWKQQFLRAESQRDLEAEHQGFATAHG